MKQKNKKTYEAPMTEVVAISPLPLMINIGSGETTPEESDANNSFFEDVEDGCDQNFSIWDDER